MSKVVDQELLDEMLAAFKLIRLGFDIVKKDGTRMTEELMYRELWEVGYGFCPACGEMVRIVEQTNNRLIGSCGDGFTTEKWEEDPYEQKD